MFDTYLLTTRLTKYTYLRSQPRLYCHVLVLNVCIRVKCSAQEPSELDLEGMISRYELEMQDIVLHWLRQDNGSLVLRDNEQYQMTFHTTDITNAVWHNPVGVFESKLTGSFV